MSNNPTSSEDDLFYEGLISSYIASPRFIERAWLAERVNTALADPDCRFLLLTAEPGAGKTAFMAWLAHEHPPWPRYFIRHDQRTPLGDVSARSLLLATGFQLAAIYPDLFTAEQVRLAVEQRIETVSESGQAVAAQIGKLYASPFYQTIVEIRQQVTQTQGTVTGIRIGELAIDRHSVPISDLQYMALINPASAMQDKYPADLLVILVDALDELRYRDKQATLLEWLTNCPTLPANVRFVLTSRPDDDLLRRFRAAQRPWLRELVLDPDDLQNHSDLNRYVLGLTEMPEVQATLRTTGQSIDEYARRLVERASGNMGYLDALARAIDSAISYNQEGLTRLLDLSALPQTLKELYSFFLHQLKSIVSYKSITVEDSRTGEERYLAVWPSVYQRILGILAVAQESLDFDLIRKLGRIQGEPADVSEALNYLRQFLDEQGGRYRLYHVTLIEFLTAETTRLSPETRDLYIDPNRWHRSTISIYRGEADNWADVNWNEVDGYGLSRLVGHLYALRDTGPYVQQLYELICEPFMLAKRQRYGWHQPFMQDVDLVIRLAGSERPPNLTQEVRACLIYARLRLLADIVPDEVLSALVSANRVEQARNIAALVSSHDLRLQAYLIISMELLEREEKEQARETLTRAAAAMETALWMRSNSEGVLYEETVVHELMRIAPFMSRAGSLEGVLPIIKAFDYMKDGHLLSWLAQDLAQSGYVQAAIQTADWALAAPESQDKAGQADTLIRLAHVQAIAGEKERAIEIARQVLEISESIEDPAVRSAIFRWLAPALARAGQVDEALSVAERLAEAVKANTLGDISRELAQSGDFDRAWNVAQAIDDIPIQASALIVLTQALARAELFGRASQVAHAIQGGDAQSLALSMLAAALARAGRLEDALLRGGVAEAMIGQIQDEETRTLVNQNVVDARLIAGRLDQFLARIQTFSSKAEKAASLAWIAERLAQLSLPESAIDVSRQALAVAMEMTNLVTRDAVLVRLVKVLTQTGEVEQALRLADAVDSFRYQAQALGDIASAYVRAGDTQQAEANIDRAFMLLEARYDHGPVVATLAHISKILADTGEKATTTALADWALSVLERILHEESRASASVWVTQMLTNAGRFGEALKVTEGIGTIPYGDDVMAILAEESAAIFKAEDSSETVEIDAASSALGALLTSSYHPSGYRAQAFSYLAVGLAESGEVQRARKAAQQALDEVKLDESNENQLRRSDALCHAAQALVLVGEFDEATMTADAVPSKLKRIFALCQVAKRLAQNGEHARALDACGRAFMLAEDTSAAFGYPDSRIIIMDDHLGRSLAAWQEWSGRHASALAEVAQAFAHAGDQTRSAEIATRAFTLAKDISYKTPKINALADVVPALVLGDLGDSSVDAVRTIQALAEQVEHAGPRATARCQAAQGLATIGQHNETLAILSAAFIDASEVGLESVLETLSEGASVLGASNHVQILSAVCQHVMEVDRWWSATR